MGNFFTDAFSAAAGDDFDEKPVSLEEFVAGEDFLNLPPLSKHQYSAVRAMSQIYYEKTLQSLYGTEKGSEIWAQTCTEVILQLAKGSGKNHSTTVAILYIVYLLLCLKDPPRYYGKPSGNNVDILNMALNADQAKNAFFNPLCASLKACRWFDNKYEIKNRHIEFDKNINLYSGNSEHGAAEGLNLIVAILDEIAGVDVEGATEGKQKTSDGIYDALSATVTSRYDIGKTIMLSFPRFKGDFIQRKYDEAIAEKEVIIREHTFKIDQNAPDGLEGNEFTIHWEEDHIIRYTYPGLFALKRPTWEVNPTKKIEDFTRKFMTNEEDALSRYCCQPNDKSETNYFKNREAIDAALTEENNVNEHGIFKKTWFPKQDTKYYLHVDLSKVHDRCSVAVAHVDEWRQVEIGNKQKEMHPTIVVDAVRWWKPSKDQPMDFKEVEQFIVDVKDKGFKIGLVTFDRWSSHDTMKSLEQRGIPTELLSVGNKHYDDFTSVLYDGRLKAPYIEQFREELRGLRWIKGKVDHPRSGFKDISDSVCGAIYDAVAHSEPPVNTEVEVLTLAQIRERNKALNETQLREKAYQSNRPGQTISPPKQMPDNIADFLKYGKVI